MKKFGLFLMIFGTFLLLPARTVRAADEPKNPARSQAETSGMPFDVKLSTMPKTPAEDFKITPATSPVRPSDQKIAPPVKTEPVEQGEAPELQKARELINTGDWRGARRISLAYLDSHAKSSDAWAILAKTYFADKKYKKAVRRFDKALKFNPHNAEAFYGKGQSFEAQGKLDEASNEYQAAMRADSQMADARTAWQRIKDQGPVAP